MAEDRIPIAPADPRATTVKPPRDAKVEARRTQDAATTGGGEEIRLADLARRGEQPEEHAAERSEAGPPGKTHPGPSGSTGEPWNDRTRAHRR